MKNWKFRTIFILVIILGVVLQFLPLWLSDAKWLSYIGSPLMCVGIVLLVSSFSYGKGTKIVNANKVPPIAPRTDEEIFIADHRYCDLQDFEKCLKLFYSPDSKSRLVIYQPSDGRVLARLQVLEIYDCDITANVIYCAHWRTIAGKDSHYADADTALKDYENELNKGYEAERVDELAPYVWGGHQEYIAEITWLTEAQGGRKNIPSGSRYWPQVIVIGSNSDIPQYSIMLRNIAGISKYKTNAFVKYAFPGAPNDLRENVKFYVCEGNRKVAKGIIKCKRENIDV